MIVNTKLLSIPPYISTSWKDVELLLSDGEHTLNVYLKNGTIIKIAHLLKEQLELIFKVHQEVLMQKPKDIPPSLIDPLFFNFSGPFLEHDPEMSDAEPLPEEIKLKLKSLVDTFPKLEKSKLPKFHDNCNCPHCQLMALLSDEEDTCEIEEVIDDKDLQFALWNVEKLTDKDFKLSHPDEPEIFHVNLNQTPCCSCQKPCCEHLAYVLRNQ